MSNFGFSAFLKLICLNDRPQRTEIRHRIIGRGDGGYDYHSSLKRLAKEILNNSITLQEALVRTNNITKLPERASAVRGLNNLDQWLMLNRDPLSEIDPPSTYVSPNRIFTVKFTPDFSRRIGDRRTAIHIWNTAKPNLSNNLVQMALALIASAYDKVQNPPQDLGVLDLPNGRLLLLSQATLVPNSGLPLAARIERIFEDVRLELEERMDQPFDRPGAPPPF